MTGPAYEILCPTCRSALSADALRCPTCAASEGSGSHSKPVLMANGDIDTRTNAGMAAEITGLGLKDYHRLVQANYGHVEGLQPGRFGGSPVVPAMLIVVLAIVVGAAIALGWL